MRKYAVRLKTGACRLFGKFLLVLVPTFLVCSLLALSYFAHREAQRDHDALASRIGGRSAFVAGALARRHRALDPFAGDLLTTLLADPAITCAEEIATKDGVALLKAPVGLGCVGQESNNVLELPIGSDGTTLLLVRYRTNEIEHARHQRQGLSFLAIVLSLLIAVAASYTAFRTLIGHRLGHLLDAIRHTSDTGKHRPVPVRGRDELSWLATAFNEMQAKLQAEAERVRRKSRELEEEVAERTKAEKAALVAKQTAEDAALLALRSARSAEVANRAKSAFLATMSHELRTPLNCILGFTDVLIARTRDEDDRSLLTLMKSSGDSLLVIISDLLDLSMIESGRIEIHAAECELRPIIETSMRLLSLRAKEKGLSMSIDFDPGLPEVVLADAHRLKQILTNLISNAIKFTHRGGVSVEARRDTPTSGIDSIVLTVRDTGIGIPEEFRTHMFDRFTQADTTSTRRYEGTGLGLAICRELVEMMGARIAVQSEVGRGSAFTVHLPLLERIPAPARLFLADSDCSTDQDDHIGRVRAAANG